MTLNRFSFYAAISTVIITLFTFVVAILTPPFSGPYCKAEKCYEYPYSDITSRFPRDYYWIYPAMVLMVSYVALMSSIHQHAGENKKIYSQIGLGFALISATIFFIDFFLQTSVIQPSLLNGETDGISILSQFNPHGIFIALEELGYIIMSISFLFMAPVFRGDKLENSIRWVFISNFVLTFLAFILYSFSYGIFREYRFEVVAISINWLGLIISGILLSKYFRKPSN